jgi:prepilin-type N-terminal cleavage/methylation domain-containing protein
MRKIKIQRGFTIVELIVVIVVLGVLVGITTIAYRSTQTRGKAITISNGIKDIERSLKALASKQGRGGWWTGAQLNPSYTANAAVPIESVIDHESSTITPPTIPGLTLTWNYQYGSADRSTSPSTCDSTINGVILRISGVNRDIITALDEILDSDATVNATLTCGKIRAANSAFTEVIYQLGFSRTSFIAN